MNASRIPLIDSLPSQVQRDELTGIELHLDRLIDYMVNGKIDATEDEIDMLRDISNRVGGYNHALDSPAHAMSYSARTKQMMKRLGAFYYNGQLAENADEHA